MMTMMTKSAAKYLIKEFIGGLHLEYKLLLKKYFGGMPLPEKPSEEWDHDKSEAYKKLKITIPLMREVILADFEGSSVYDQSE